MRVNLQATKCDAWRFTPEWEPCGRCQRMLRPLAWLAPLYTHTVNTKGAWSVCVNIKRDAGQVRQPVSLSSGGTPPVSPPLALLACREACIQRSRVRGIDRSSVLNTACPGLWRRLSNRIVEWHAAGSGEITCSVWLTASRQCRLRHRWLAAVLSGFPCSVYLHPLFCPPHLCSCHLKLHLA